jgi:hypothetical protein
MCKEGNQFDQILREVFVKGMKQDDDFSEEKYSYKEHLVD